MSETPFAEPGPRVTPEQIKQVRLAKKTARDQVTFQLFFWGLIGGLVVIAAAGVWGRYAVVPTMLAAFAVAMIAIPMQRAAQARRLERAQALGAPPVTRDGMRVFAGWL